MSKWTQIHQNMKIKKRPKQNFNVNHDAILDSKLNERQKSILIKTLNFHKANCKFEYKNFLNIDLANQINASIPTLLAHRKLLEQDKYFVIKKIRCGKSYVLEYRFNWTKLSKLEFITPIEENPFTP